MCMCVSTSSLTSEAFTCTKSLKFPHTVFGNSTEVMQLLRCKVRVMQKHLVLQKQCLFRTICAGIMAGEC